MHTTAYTYGIFCNCRKGDFPNKISQWDQMDAKILMNVLIMVVTRMQTVSTLPVVSNAHVKKDSEEMAISVLI